MVLFALCCAVMCTPTMEIGGSALEIKTDPLNTNKENLNAVLSIFSIQLPDSSIMDSNRQQQPLTESSSESLATIGNPEREKPVNFETIQEQSPRSFMDYSGAPHSQFERKKRDLQSNQRVYSIPMHRKIKRDANKSDCHFRCYPEPPYGCGYECTF